MVFEAETGIAILAAGTGDPAFAAVAIVGIQVGANESVINVLAAIGKTAGVVRAAIPAGKLGQTDIRRLDALLTRAWADGRLAPSGRFVANATFAAAERTIAGHLARPLGVTP